jgi:hypothetical protein
MVGTIPLLPQYALMVWCSVKAQIHTFNLNFDRHGLCVHFLSVSMKIDINLNNFHLRSAQIIK